MRVLLKQQGYDGNVIVDISADDLDEFGCDWEGADETRFPARIRAAATALRDSGCAGRFNIVHTNGILTIVRLA